MARRTATAPRPSSDEIEAAELSDILKTIGDDNVLIKLFRQDPQGRQKFQELLPREAIENGTIESMIQERFPQGGTFVIRVLQAGKFIKGGNKTIHVEALPNYQGIPASYTDDSSIQFQMMKMQMEMQNKSDERMLTMMQGFNTSIMGMMTAILSNNKPLDPLTLMQVMNAGGGGGLGQLKDAIAIVTELKGDGGGGKDDPMTAIATSAVNRLIDKTMGGTPAPAAGSPPAHLPPNNPPAALPAAEPPQPPAAEPAAQENMEFTQRLAFLAELKALAATAKTGEDLEDDVDLAAEMIERMAPIKPPCRWILDVVREYPWEAVQGGLVRADADINKAPYADFFQKLYDRLKNPPEES